jgi:hypothetical protein
VSGLIEAPGLAESLTLNKGDFLRAGPRGLVYLGFRRAIQQAVAAQLAAWGSAPGPDDRAQRRIARPVERDLETVLVDLAAEFPALSALVDRRPGGQRKLPSGAVSPEGPTGAAVAVASSGTSAVEPPDSSSRAEGTPASESTDESPGPSPAAEPPPKPEAADSSVTLPGAARGPRKPARYALGIHFEEQAESSELARLVEAKVLVNTAHPAWRRAVASRSEGYHIALSVAMALAPLAADTRGMHAFVTAFLARWGEALGRDRRRRGAR